MNKDTKYCITIIVIILLILLACFAVCHETESTKREAIKAGLVEKEQRDSTATIWTKPE